MDGWMAGWMDGRTDLRKILLHSHPNDERRAGGNDEHLSFLIREVARMEVSGGDGHWWSWGKGAKTDIARRGLCRVTGPPGLL